ncbi:MAG TPA: hypothetical protein VK432_09245 [Stellaceae bacterium]|nr:hypothetical protein [Stellaceae bacterium]
MPVPTIYLSRLIGVVGLIAGAAMLLDRQPPIAALGALSSDPALLYVMGILGIVAGAAIVLIHNLWNRGLPALLVTLMGWLLLIRGVALMLLPPDLLGGIVASLHFAEFYYLYAAIPLLLGAYLSLKGFNALLSSDEHTTPSPPSAEPQAAKTRPRPRR